MKQLPHLLALLAGLFLSGPAWAQQKMTFTPQWTPQAQFAGYYVALELGFYKDAGIDLEIVHPNATESAITRLRNNSSQITTLQLCQAMETIDNGVPLANLPAKRCQLRVSGLSPRTCAVSVAIATRRSRTWR